LEGARGPGGGLLYWQPRPGVFPSGLTGWLGLPLSLYAPAYSAESVYVREERYGFVVDGFTQHAIPTQRAFYDELFANGTRANMIMFEQDFLCAISDATTLVNRDLNTGANTASL